MEGGLASRVARLEEALGQLRSGGEDREQLILDIKEEIKELKKRGASKEKQVEELKETVKVLKQSKLIANLGKYGHLDGLT